MAVYGIFDGHGGKQAANYASRNLADKLLSAIGQADRSDFKDPDSAALEQLRSCTKLDSKDWEVWEGQDQLTECLPGSLVQAFQRLQSDFFEQCKVSCLNCTLLTPTECTGSGSCTVCSQALLRAENNLTRFTSVEQFLSSSGRSGVVRGGSLMIWCDRKILSVEEGRLPGKCQLLHAMEG
jgi:hypothetical protein